MELINPLTYIGLDSLTEVGEDFILGTYAQTLAGLGNLKFVGRKLHISGDSLKSLTALANLDTVRQLTISYCQKLTSLSGIDNLDSKALGAVVINYNQVLSHCAVKSICDRQDLGGTYFIGVNTGECADTAAVRQSCREGTDIQTHAMGISGPLAMVNTERGGIGVHLELKQATQVAVRVFDTRGKLVASRPFELNPAGRREILVPIPESKPGVFMVEVQMGHFKSIQKVFL